MFLKYLNVCDLSLLEGREEKKNIKFLLFVFSWMFVVIQLPTAQRRLKADHSQCQNSQAS